MILKDSFYYSLARGLPGIINFLSIVFFTRLLPPENYGIYALIIATVAFLNTILFQWIRVALARFFHQNAIGRSQVMQGALVAFWGVSSIAAFITTLFVTIYFLICQSWPIWAFYVLVILIGQAWLELNLELARGNFNAKLYGFISSIRALGVLIFGIALVALGLDYKGLLISLFVVLWCLGGWSFLVNWYPLLKSVKSANIPLKPMFVFGFPLTGTFALGVIVSSLDRFMLSYFQGPGATGQYAVGYDLAWNLINLLMLIVNLAVYPHIMRTHEEENVAAVKSQFKVNGVLLLAVALPAVIFLSLLMPQLSIFIVGEQYYSSVNLIVPIICVAAFLKGIKSYYFDQVFHMFSKTAMLVWIMAVAAVVNTLLNFLLIPDYGIYGAALATLVSFGVSLILSAFLSLKLFPVPLWSVDVTIVFGFNLAVALIFFYVIRDESILYLIGGVPITAVLYFLGLYVLNVADVKTVLKR